MIKVNFIQLSSPTAESNFKIQNPEMFIINHLHINIQIILYFSNKNIHTFKNYDKYIIQIFTEVIIKFLLYACI